MNVPDEERLPQAKKVTAMSYDSRVLNQLEVELSKRLTFTFCHAAGESTAACRPRLQDVLELDVWVRNDSEFRLRQVRGTISPSTYVRYRYLEFSVPELLPGDSAHLARIQMLVTALPTHGTVLDQAGSVIVSAVADLSRIEFQEWDKPLIYAQPPDRTDTETEPSIRLRVGNARAAIRPGLTLSGLPLSEV